MRNGIATLLALLCFSVSAFAAEYGHYELGAWPSDYGQPGSGWKPEFNVGRLHFVGQMPDPSALSPAEQFIVCGGRDKATGWTVDSWAAYLVQQVSNYYDRTGEMPEQFGPAECARLQALGAGEYGEKTLSRLVNPLTGEYPRLNGPAGEPGAITCLALTQGEMRLLADNVPHYQDIWFNGDWYNPEIGQRDQITYFSPVIFIQVRGIKGVIYEDIHFVWTVKSDTQLVAPPGQTQ
ncbi:hypothetical protein IT575_12340 [bacterium]|nr:hypothetical protein [bacterium]